MRKMLYSAYLSILRYIALRPSSHDTHPLQPDHARR